MGNNVVCWKTQPSYARYHSNAKENEPDLENVIASLLEMDPSLQDREEGVSKINSWIEEISPDISMSPEHIEISRWKCIKYWEAQHSSDIYGNDHTIGVKLTGSCVRFYFERKCDATGVPRLVIEHCGRTVQVRNNQTNIIPYWVKNLKASTLKRFKRPVREDRCDSYGASVTDSLASRYE